MIIFKDLLTGDELFSDAFDFDPDFQDGTFYKLKVQKVKVGGAQLDGAAFGFNASEENPDEGTADADDIVTVWDVVDQHQLMEAPQFDRNGFKAYFKPFAKAVASKLKEEGREDDAKDFQKKALAGMKYLVDMIKKDDVEVWNGSSQNPDGSAGYINWETDANGDDVPFMLFFKHAVVSEKV